jgi:hypothetical protein
VKAKGRVKAREKEKAKAREKVRGKAKVRVRVKAATRVAKARLRGLGVKSGLASRVGKCHFTEG